ncbi:MAG: tetratricopeptide repeat protein [Candidatus Zixiibacteriota bacterium]
MSRSPIPARVLMAYSLTVLGFFTASFFPESRAWGLNIWAWFPLTLRIGLLVVGFAVGAAVWRWGNWLARDNAVRSGVAHSLKHYIIPASFAIACAGILFYLFRTQTHFLGDGYLELITLVSPNPDIMYREIGETLAHSLLFSALTGTAPERALVAYQIISIAAGVLFLLVIAVGAWSLFDNNRSRLLFLAGVATGGFMLLYFGYVEHYSLFSVAAGALVLGGLLALHIRMNRYWLIPMLAFGLFLHILTVILVPAVLYALLSGTQLGNRIRALSRSKKVLYGSLAVAPVVGLIAYFLATDFFFRLAFVSPVAHRFTVEGYTLFSWAHLVDWLNLILTHLPGVAVILAALSATSAGRLFAHREYRFLTILLICAGVASFVIDPKLGMPRDWDLFSFAGIPLVVAGFYWLNDSRTRSPHTVPTMILVVTLGLLSLGPRVATQALPSEGLKQIRAYAALDPIKNKNVLLTLRNYYLEHNDPHTADEIFQLWNSYPEQAALEQADALGHQGRNAEAVQGYRAAIDLNPYFAPSYVYLGQMLNRLGQYDSAITVLETAYGLAPRNPNVNTALGYALWWSGHKEEGKRHCEAAIAFNPEMSKPYYFLANICREEGDAADYERYLRSATGKNDATGVMFKELADIQAARGEYSPAALNYRRAVEKGLDSAEVRVQVAKHPGLREWLPAFGGPDSTPR